MVGKQEIGDIGVQGGVTNGVAKVKRIKTLKKFQTKFFKYCITQFNIKVCKTPKHPDPHLVPGIILIYQDVMIGYVNLRAKMKVCGVYILW